MFTKYICKNAVKIHSGNHKRKFFTARLRKILAYIRKKG